MSEAAWIAAGPNCLGGVLKPDHVRLRVLDRALDQQVGVWRPELATECSERADVRVGLLDQRDSVAMVAQKRGLGFGRMVLPAREGPAIAAVECQDPHHPLPERQSATPSAAIAVNGTSGTSHAQLTKATPTSARLGGASTISNGSQRFTPV